MLYSLRHRRYKKWLLKCHTGVGRNVSIVGAGTKPRQDSRSDVPNNVELQGEGEGEGKRWACKPFGQSDWVGGEVARKRKPVRRREVCAPEREGESP